MGVSLESNQTLQYISLEEGGTKMAKEKGPKRHVDPKEDAYLKRCGVFVDLSDDARELRRAMRKKPRGKKPRSMQDLQFEAEVGELRRRVMGK